MLSPGSVMHNGGEQTSLWQQSDLLDLVAAAQASAAAHPDQAQHRGTAQQDEPAPRNPADPTADDAAMGSASAGLATAEAAASSGQGAHPRNQDSGAGPASVTAETADAALIPPGGEPAEDSPDIEPAPLCQAAPSAGEPATRSVATSLSAAEATPGRRQDTHPSHQAMDAGRAALTARQEPQTERRADAAAPIAAADADPAPAPGVPGLPACPQRLLILDTETTALSPQQGQCIEVGAVLFDVASRAVLMQVSFLMPCSSNPAEHVNGIPAAVSRLQQPWRSGLSCFEAMVADADALLAHNAAFDRQWFGSGELPALDKPWICSMEDIRWPADRQLRATPSVRDLALAYGVPVWAAHRALTDCIYLVQVFQRCDELEPLLQAALEPRHLVRARLSYDERQLAKDAGFRWNEPVPKAWSRRLSEREIAALPFPVDPVEAEEPARQRREGAQPLWRRSA